MILTDTLIFDGLRIRVGEKTLPVKQVDIDGQVDGRGVVWTVTAQFLNDLEMPTEAEFSLPLPHRGAVVGMTMKIGKREVAAEIKEREQARIEYETAKNSGYTASIFEQQRTEIFTIGVGNIHPNEPISIVVTIHDMVSVEGNEATLRMPTMIKERFIPAGTPDAHVIAAATADNDIRPSGSIGISFANAVEDLVCDADVLAKITPTSVVIDESALLGDIVIRWTVPSVFADAKWVADDDNPEMGTLEVTARVDEPKNTKKQRRAVQIMLDRSGSMRSHYLEWARRITSDVLAGLSAEDLVHVLTFDSVIEALTPTEFGFQPADKTTKQAIERELLNVYARGGTSLVEALNASGAALATLDDRHDSQDFERVAVLITDGAYGDEATAAHQREMSFKNARVIAVAIGENANGFLEVLASNGTCVFVPSAATLGEASSKVQSRLNSVVHSDVRLSVRGLTQHTPLTAPNIYPNIVTTLHGRMPRPQPGDTVQMVSSDGVIATLEIVASSDSSITTRWANEYLKGLDYKMMSSQMDAAESESLEKEIISTSIRFKILSKYTAWLAVDYSRTTDQVITQRIDSYFDDEFEFRTDLLVNYTHVPMRQPTEPFLWPLKSLAPIWPNNQAPELSEDFLKTLRECFGEDYLDESPGHTSRWKGIKKFMQFLASLFRRRRKSQRRR